MRTLFLLSFVAILLGACRSRPTAKANRVDAVLVTEVGEIAIDLYDQTPQHRDNFLKLARDNYFDSMVFHRIIYEFMIQTGDPRTREDWPAIDTAQADGPGYQVPAELGPHSVNTPGKLGAARQPDEENPERRSAGSQFYIVAEGEPVSPRVIDSMEQAYTSQLRGVQYQAYRTAADSHGYPGSFQDYLAEQDFQPWHYPGAERAAYRENGGAPWLYFTYTVFGEVVAGMDVVNRINAAPTDTFNRPTRAIRILDVTIPDTLLKQ